MTDTPVHPVSASTFRAADEVCAGSAASAGQRVELTAIDPTKDSQWNSHIRRFPGATCFHSSEWVEVLRSAYGFSPCFAVSPEVVIPLVEVRGLFGKLRGVGLPFTDFCEPLMRNCSGTSDTERACRSLLQFGRSRGWKSLELRGGVSLLGAAAPFLQCLTHNLDLSTGEGYLWGHCSPACQRAIRKARSSGVVVRKGHDHDDLARFFHLQCRTRRKHGIPPQPESFFRSLEARLFSTGRGSLYLAEASGQVIAAAIFLTFEKWVIFKYGASDERFLDLRANNLLMWQAIADYSKSGFASLNLGRTELDHSGLSRYKLSFGAVESRVNYYCYDYTLNRFVSRSRSGLHKIMNPFFRHAPLALSRMCGAALYRHAA